MLIWVYVYTCVYQGERNVRFSWKIWRVLFSCYLRFKIRLFALSPTYVRWLKKLLCFGVTFLKQIKAY